MFFNLKYRENAATKMSPSKALLGYELPRPGDRNATGTPTEKDRSCQLMIFRRNQAEYQPMSRRRQVTRPTTTTTREKVWDVPYTVVRCEGHHTYTARNNDETPVVKVHLDCFRPSPPPRLDRYQSVPEEKEPYTDPEGKPDRDDDEAIDDMFVPQTQDTPDKDEPEPGPSRDAVISPPDLEDCTDHNLQ